MNWKEYDKVREFVTDIHDELCHHDAVAEYLFVVYNALHHKDYAHAFEDGTIDWDSVNRIDVLITDRLAELGRVDDWTQGELASRDFSCFENVYGSHYKYESGGIESYMSETNGRWDAVEYVTDGEGRTMLVLKGSGDTAQHALDRLRLVLPVRGKYHVKFCLGGRKGRVEFEESFDDRDEYEGYVESLPFDFIDANDTTHWVDYGD